MCQLFLFNKVEGSKIDGVSLLKIFKAIAANEDNKDGFGFVFEDAKGSFKIFKHGFSGDLPPFRRETRYMNEARGSKWIMAHVRAKTRGEINHVNAQPFMVRSLIGAHNGTFYDLGTERWSDSKEFFHELYCKIKNLSNKDEILKKIKSHIEEREGTAAILIRYQDLQVVYKSSGRNLYIAYINNGEASLAVTSLKTLKQVLDVYNQINPPVIYEIFSVNDNMLFTVEGITLKAVYKKVEMRKRNRSDGVYTWTYGTYEGYKYLMCNDNLLAGKKSGAYISSLDKKNPILRALDKALKKTFNKNFEEVYISINKKEYPEGYDKDIVNELKKLNKKNADKGNIKEKARYLANIAYYIYMRPGVKAPFFYEFSKALEQEIGSCNLIEMMRDYYYTGGISHFNLSVGKRAFFDLIW